jgi:hypothetical protein
MLCLDGTGSDARYKVVNSPATNSRSVSLELHHELISMSLLKLPPELWSIILGLVCTDGGKAGCALSLVSREINKATALERYLSVSLLGWDSIKSFASEVKRLGGIMTVRYLFIATLQSSNDGCGDNFYGFSNSDDEDEEESPGLSVYNSPAPSNGTDLVHLIWRAVRCTLTSFSGFGLPLLIPGDMSALRDLTLHYADNSSPDCDTFIRELKTEESVALQRLTFPTLRRVHLTGRIACELPVFLAKRAIGLQIIRCSRPKGGVAQIANSLHNAFPTTGPSGQLVRVILQPAPEYHPCGNGRRWSIGHKHMAVREAIRHTEWLVDTVDLWSWPSYQPLKAQDQMEEWLSTVRGWEGPWDITKSTPSFKAQKSTKTKGLFLESEPEHARV